MTTIDKILIALRSSGVDFHKMGDVLERTSNLRWSEVQGSQFQYIDLTSVDRVTRAIRDTESIDSTNAPSRAQQIVREGDVIFGTTRPMLKRYCLIPRAFDGQVCSTGFCVLRPRPNRLLASFLFHLMGTETFYSYVEANQRGTNYPAIADHSVKAYRIPLPPIEVQREIVKVLDSFTELEAELEAQLDTELEARRRQYQYYRDVLLRRAGNMQAKTLGEVGTFTRGRRFTNKDFVESGVGCIHYGEIYTHYGLSATRTKSFLRPTLAAALRMAKKGDLIIAGTGENVGEVCKAVAWLGDDDVAVHDDCYIFAHSLNPKYAAYLFQSSDFNEQKIKYAAGAKMIRVSSESLEKICVPVPPLEEQHRIVAILDHLVALMNELSIGLPAELKARRQQYEYYRDRLLTFREAA